MFKSCKRERQCTLKLSKHGPAARKVARKAYHAARISRIGGKCFRCQVLRQLDAARVHLQHKQVVICGTLHLRKTLTARKSQAAAVEVPRAWEVADLKVEISEACEGFAVGLPIRTSPSKIE